MKVTEKIAALRHNFKLPVAPGIELDRYVFSYLIMAEKIVLIDSGVNGSEQTIYDFIRKSGRSIGDIETLILSHAHPDHIGAANKIKKDTQCTVVAHELEKNWIEDIEVQFHHRPVPGFYNLVNESVNVDLVIEDNETIYIDKDMDLRMLHTPGHSPGLLSVLCKNEGVLFSGDVVPLVNDIPNYDNKRQLIESLNRINTTKNYNILLSSFIGPVIGKSEIEKHIQSGFEYINKIELAVNEVYRKEEENSLESCEAVINDLQLHPAFVNPLVHNAFLSHL